MIRARFMGPGMLGAVLLLSAAVCHSPPSQHLLSSIQHPSPSRILLRDSVQHSRLGVLCLRGGRKGAQEEADWFDAPQDGSDSDMRSHAPSLDSAEDLLPRMDEPSSGEKGWDPARTGGEEGDEELGFVSTDDAESAVCASPVLCKVLHVMACTGCSTEH